MKLKIQEDGGIITDEQNRTIAIPISYGLDGTPDKKHLQMISNARRIVRCVNLLSHLSDEQLREAECSAERIIPPGYRNFNADHSQSAEPVSLPEPHWRCSIGAHDPTASDHQEESHKVNTEV